MTKGRPRKDPEIKKLQGTDRNDRRVEAVKGEVLTKVPRPTMTLRSKEEKAHYRRLCKILISVGQLTTTNVDYAVLMAKEWVKYEEADKNLSDETVITTKSGYQQPSPWVAISNQALKNFVELASRFGLDPLSALKIPKAKVLEKDSFDKLLSKYK